MIVGMEILNKLNCCEISTKESFFQCLLFSWGLKLLKIKKLADKIYAGGCVGHLWLLCEFFISNICGFTDLFQRHGEGTLSWPNQARYQVMYCF